MLYETYKITHHIGAITSSMGIRGADRNLVWNLTLKNREWAERNRKTEENHWVG